jgi:hypothetical protein
MPKGPQGQFRLSVEAKWAAQAKLKAELAELESGELVLGQRRRGCDWEDITRERIVDVKSELIALNIELNLLGKSAKKLV